MKKIGILVDSSATCQPKIFENTVIEWIPLHLTYIKENIDILDTESNIQKYKVFEKISNGESWKTSQASLGEISQKYKEMLTRYERIVYIPITENLSSMMNTSIIVSKDEEFAKKVTVIKNVSLAAQAIKEIAINLSEKIQKNELKNVEEVVREFDKLKTQTYIGIIPSDLKSLSSGGRAVKLIGTVLNIFKTKLLIRWVEKPEKEALGRTVSGLTERVVKKINEEFSGKKFHLIITGLTKFADKNLNMIGKIFKENNINFSVEPIPHLYPVHSGIETVGFIAWSF